MNCKGDGVRQTAVTPIIHVQLIRGQKLLEPEMRLVPEPHQLEPTKKCCPALKRCVIYQTYELPGLRMREDLGRVLWVHDDQVGSGTGDLSQSTRKERP